MPAVVFTCSQGLAHHKPSHNVRLLRVVFALSCCQLATTGVLKEGGRISKDIRKGWVRLGGQTRVWKKVKILVYQSGLFQLLGFEG